MRRLLILLLIGMSLQAKPFTNALIDEESPYLQLHAHQRIAWLPWNEESFETARREHKPIFLSIGYSTCHWCHVMSRESFEDDAIAEILNRYFISIKVDREEMPHIDSYYQNIYQKVHHRSGGWPLTVMMSEKQEVFFITTYIPNIPKYGVEGLNTTLMKFVNLYRKRPENIAKRIRAIVALQAKKTVLQQEASTDAKSFFHALEEEYDAIYHGFGIAPKFPEASKIELLFVLHDLGFVKARQMALNVLRTMALRGIYDQIDGGFFRYCVDANWEIPHFEKMLYNQAELIPLYVKAYQITQDKLYSDIVKETINMVYTRFEQNALFYSASNADVNHKEGAYFSYRVDEVSKALLEYDANRSIAKAMEFRGHGNFDNRVHIGFYTSERPKGFQAFRSALKILRVDKEYPFIDMKIIASWNAMMITALFEAGVIDERYELMAKISLENFSRVLEKKGILYHQSYRGNTPYVKGLLEDYAAAIQVYIKAYEKTYDRRYLEHSEQLMQRALRLFYRNGEWYLNASEPSVSVDLNDKYYTSAMGMMLQNMQRLAAMNGTLALQHIANKSLDYLEAHFLRHVTKAPSTARAWLMRRYGVVTLKQQKAVLLGYKNMLQHIAYPFLVTRASRSKEFLACKVDRCFSYSKDFLHVKEAIEKSLQK